MDLVGLPIGDTTPTQATGGIIVHHFKKAICALGLTSGSLLLAGPVDTVRGQCLVYESAKVLASDGAEGDNFGYSVSLSGDVTLIGAEYDDDAGSASGSAYVYRLIGSAWIEEAKLTASDAAESDWFGASVSVSGDVAVVGAYGDDDLGEMSGSAYVYRFSGSAWIEEAKLHASTGATNDRFGRSVSVSGDVAVIGAPWDDWEAGSVWVYRYTGSAWVEEAKLSASDGAANDFFGYSVAICDDIIVVGAKYDDDNGSKSGSAYVFRFDDSSWVEQAKLRPSDGALDDEFGYSVSVSGDVVVIGAWYDDDSGSESGSAYVFEKPPGGWENMTQTAKLLPSDGAAEDYFGISVAASANVALIGAHRNDDNGSASGSAYVFLHNGSGWVEGGKLLASDGGPSDLFGYSVDVSDSTAVVSAYKTDDNGDSSGSAYVVDGLLDCNANGTVDSCDIAGGTSEDVNDNGIPDECERSIPTVSEWGMVVMALLVLATGTLVYTRRRPV